jgi:uncharacterized protein with von Willebrand factor type A (vWA) domain
MSIASANHGRMAENVMHFARVLRRAGLPVGPDKVVEALRALEIAGISRRDDFYWTLASVFIDRRAQLDLFDQAFHIFWRDPHLLERVMQLLLPTAYGRGVETRHRVSARVLSAPLAGTGRREEVESARNIEIDASFTSSPGETLQAMDFESMSVSEFSAARAAVAQMRAALRPLATRRYLADARGSKIDLRASLRASLRDGGAVISLKRRRRAKRLPPLVALCDVSGSMNRYTRMFLHFLHAVSAGFDRVQALTFGTRLTLITRHLRQRDADVALEDVGRAVPDWAGGTRIGACLHEFNLRWSRRLLAQGAVVLLISDGLDRDAGAGLSYEMDRLHKSCRKLIWLNPLLRYAEFEARPAGVKAMLPHVDAFLPVHNLRSLRQLVTVLSEESLRSRRSRRCSSRTQQC